MRVTYPKKLVPIGDLGFGRFSFQACPLQGINVSQRRQPDYPDDTIIITPLPKAEAVTTLMRSGIVSAFRRWLPFHQHKLRRLSDLVAHIPVRKVIYPSGYDLLPTVRDAILADIEKLP